MEERELSLLRLPSAFLCENLGGLCVKIPTAVWVAALPRCVECVAKRHRHPQPGEIANREGLTRKSTLLKVCSCHPPCRFSPRFGALAVSSPTALAWRCSVCCCA